MSELRELNLDQDSRPPWESDAVDNRPPWETMTDEEAGAPAQVPASRREDLEIFRKAANFKKLTLVSGNSIDVPVEQYIKQHYGKEGITRLALAKHLMNALNLIPSDDVLLMLSCTNKARTVIATAGAGKTTSLHLDLIVSKMLDSILHTYHLDPVPIPDTEITVSPILYLNYNKHNVQPIYNKHSGLCAKVNKTIVEQISDDIESSTVHSFCHKWLGAFAFSIQLPELTIATDDDRQKLWTAVMVPRWERFYGDNEVGVEWQTLDELYVFKTEAMMDWEPFFQSAKFVDTGLKPEFVKSCIKKYDGMKKAMKLMDFTDYLLMMIDVMKTHPDLKAKVQDRYKIIVADENQDFTALMNELLLQLYNPEKNRLIVVGDPDQTIYQFKGVSPDNVVNLVSRLENCAVLGIDTNYRCPDQIVSAAKRILSLNILRFEKPINTVKTGGKIVKHPLRVVANQYKEVLGILKAHGPENYGKTVLTYRNNRTSIILGEELYYANIPFSVLDARRPFNNLVFRHIQQALLALKEKDNIDLNKGLYRFLPMPKDMWSQILEANAKRRHYHFHDLIIPDGVPSGTTSAISMLVDISMRVESSPCSDYIGVLFQLYRKYYFDFLMRNPNPAVGDEDLYGLLLERTMKFWSRPHTFDYMQQELHERNVDRPDAVMMSTFHGLKGLEFDYVIAADFNETLFPNFFGIEQRYPENTALEEKEAENRLCYVLVTRAIKELHLLYNESDPSVYVDILCDTVGDTATPTATIEDINLGGVSIPTDTTAAKLSFIQRLTGERRR